MTDYQGTEQQQQAPEAPEVRVRFGPKGHQNVSLEVAEMILTLWRERQPAGFGAYLSEVMTGEKPSTGSRARK